MNYEERILKYLKENKKLIKNISLTRLKKETKISYPTILKYILVLEAKEKIVIENLGVIKLVSLKNDK